MKTYVINKLLSFSAVFLCIFITLAIFGYGQTQWQAILLAIIIFGYAHFFLGFYYQLKGFLRKSQPEQYLISFGVLSLLSVGFAYLVFEYIGFVVALFLGFLYFLFHGLLNEQTLVLRQTGIKVPLLFLSALAVFIIALLIYSVPDETFFFNRQLQFMDISSAWVEYLFDLYYISLANFTYIFWGGIGLSGVTLFSAWRRFGFSKLSLFLATAFTAITALVFLFGPPSYIYMYLFVVGYHFMTWLLFYVVEMKQRGRKVYLTFLLQNVLIIGLFIWAASLFFQPYVPAWVHVLFDYNLFVIMTYVHISTSFLNDEWLQNIQSKIFKRMAR